MKKIISIIIILIIGLIIFFQTNKPNQEVISISDEIYLIIDDKIFLEDNPVIIEDNTIFISFDVIKENIDPYIFYDINEKILIFTNDEKVIRYKLDENYATINHREFYHDKKFKILNDKIYIPKEILMNFYPIEILYFEDTKAVIIEENFSNYIQGQIIEEGGNLRVNFDKKSPIVLKDIPLESEVIIFEEYMDWYKIRTYNGIIGYIEKKYLKINHRTKQNGISKNFKEEYKSNNEKINLTWDYTYGKMKNIDNIEYIDGLNILSPTWFSIIDREGNIFDKGNPDYVEEYQALGYKIWPLIDNGFDPDLTHELLVSSQMREKLIKDIALIYNKYKVDGINIDFENINIEDKDLLTQFVRELYPIFKEMDMIVSMDISPISTSENWSLCYDRYELSKTVDYLMLMAYDQHWASSPVAGSVAQYIWVEESIIKVLEEVPKEKLILGIPFYTRLWKYENREKGEELSSYALSMEKANEFIERYNIQLEWDEESNQYYGEVKIEDTIYKIWLEDKDSIKFKTTLVNKYDLAGIASWRRGFETEDIWPVLSNTIRLN